MRKRGRDVVVEREEALQERKRDLLEALREDEASAFEEVKRLHPADIADLVEELDAAHRRSLLTALETGALAEVVEETVPSARGELLRLLPEERIREVLSRLPLDGAADLLDALPEEQVERMLAGLKESKATALRDLSAYPADSAGGMMTIDVMRLPAEVSAAEAIKRIQGVPQFEVVDRIFLEDRQGRLVGMVNAVDLLRLPPERKVREAVRGRPVSVLPETDREEVVRVFDKYDEPVVPVVDEAGRLLGAITHDDAIDAIREEASEDIYRIAGTGARNPAKEHTLRRVVLRLPFLGVTLGGEIVLAFIAKRFELTLHNTITLAFFIPVVNAVGGNVGLQSSAMVVRGLALGEIQIQRLAKMLLREVFLGVTIGAICALAVAGVAYGLEGQRPGAVALAVGVAMFCGVMVAAVTGTAIPLVMRRVRLDPALAAGPFITTLNDVTCLTIYLTAATLFLSGAG